jgi:hypothetical protein
VKIIFLDMDGVLNCHSYLYDRNRKKEIVKAESMFITGRDDANNESRLWESMIDPNAVKRLNHIIQRTGAKVVLSSSWRYAFPNFKDLEPILRKRGFEGELVDRTKLGKEMLLRHEKGAGIRGYEVAEWLERHPSVDSFVILDDADDFPGLDDRLVRTRWATGLLDEHVTLAIKILERPR